MCLFISHKAWYIFQIKFQTSVTLFQILIMHSFKSTFQYVLIHFRILYLVKYLLWFHAVPNIRNIYFLWSFFSHYFFFLAFLTFHLNKFQSDVWIGLNDINEDQMYLWTDGRGVRYTNWDKGFPLSFGQSSVGIWLHDGIWKLLPISLLYLLPTQPLLYESEISVTWLEEKKQHE